MKLTIKQPLRMTDGSIKLTEVPLDKVVVDTYCIMSIDGSTTNSGIAILREHDGALLYLMSAKREKTEESPVQYKVRLKRAITDILRRNQTIYQVFYEEPVVANVTAVKNLFMLRTFIEEIKVENEPEFDYLKNIEVPNTRWKKLFLEPDKLPSDSESQKKAVKEKMVGYLPFMADVTQDEIDAACMGWVAAQMLSKNIDAEKELKSKTKPRAFQYNSVFLGAETDDGLFDNFHDAYNGPEKLLQNGINLVEIDSKTDFNKAIYNEMGDEDKVLIIKFSSSHHGNIILEHRIGNLAAQFSYIYAIVWRKSRKIKNSY